MLGKSGKGNSSFINGDAEAQPRWASRCLRLHGFGKWSLGGNPESLKQGQYPSLLSLTWSKICWGFPFNDLDTHTLGVTVTQNQHEEAQGKDTKGDTGQNTPKESHTHCSVKCSFQQSLVKPVPLPGRPGPRLDLPRWIGSFWSLFLPLLVLTGSCPWILRDPQLMRGVLHLPKSPAKQIAV